MACDLPALDLSRAIYSSRYLRFMYGSAGTLSGRKFHRNRTLPASEAALFQRYACTPARFGCGDPRVRVSDFLEMIDRYEQTASQFLDVSVFRLPVTPGADASTVTPTFNQVRDALATGTEPADGSDLVTYVNAEANIMTALICHVDGKRPASVCKRGAIKAILRSVK